MNERITEVMMDRSFSAAAIVGVLSLFVGACQPGDPSDGEATAEARLPQIDVGDLDYRHYWAEINESPVIDILVIGDEDIGPYNRNTEYWFVQEDALADIGEKDLVFDYADGDGAPPSLEGDQKFTQPVYLTWQSFSSDPVSGGELHSKGDHHLRIEVTGSQISRLTWYQVLPGQNPENITPTGEYVPAGGSVSVPSGYYGYYIDAAIE